MDRLLTTVRAAHRIGQASKLFPEGSSPGPLAALAAIVSTNAHAFRSPRRCAAGETSANRPARRVRARVRGTHSHASEPHMDFYFAHPLESISDPAFWSGLGSIILIDLVLAGDNAVVIALAARNLPKELQFRAIFWGSFGAIAVRVAMTAGVLWLLKIPGL